MQHWNNGAKFTYTEKSPQTKTPEVNREIKIYIYR